MNEIAQRQNEEHFIQLLAAQRQLYRDYKHQTNVWVFIGTLFAILGTAAVSYSKPPIAIGSVLLVALEFIMLPMVNTKRTQAAQIQEMFDTELLELPWNSAMAAKPPSALITKSAMRHLRDSSPEIEQELHDWYDVPDLPNYPLYQARIIAQRENIWWDSEQRREYVRWLTIGTLVLIMLLSVVGFVPNWDLQQFNATPLLLFLPLIVMALRNLSEHRNAADRLDLLHTVAENLWSEAIAAGADSSKRVIAELERRSRELQTEIYHHRSQNPPILDWVYNRIKVHHKVITQTSGSFTR